MHLPRPVSLQPADPLLAMRMPHRRLFHPLGFALEIETNSEEILDAAAESWREQSAVSSGNDPQPPLVVRIGVTPSTTTECPPAPNFRANGHLLSIVADHDNFATCDLERGFAFGWVSAAALLNRSYLRYHFLEAIVMCLLTGSRVTPIHAASVSLNGHGLLLCGESGAGKSTLAYACARAGFTLTSDDASYVVWESIAQSARVRANCHQLRFRPSGRDFFPELAGLSLTPRLEGKPSIEVCTAELDIAIAPEVPILTILLLNRHAGDDPPELNPLGPAAVLPHLENSLYALEGIHERQSAALRPLMACAMYEFRYRDLACAIASLRQLIGA